MHTLTLVTVDMTTKYKRVTELRLIAEDYLLLIKEMENRLRHGVIRT